MPKLELTSDEITIIANAMDLSIKSAKRAQNSGRTPQIKAVYAEHERIETALMHKVLQAK